MLNREEAEKMAAQFICGIDLPDCFLDENEKARKVKKNQKVQVEENTALAIQLASKYIQEIDLQHATTEPLKKEKNKEHTNC